MNVFVAGMSVGPTRLAGMRITVGEVNDNWWLFTIVTQMRVRIGRSHDEKHQCEQAEIDMSAAGRGHGRAVCPSQLGLCTKWNEISLSKRKFADPTCKTI